MPYCLKDEISPATLNVLQYGNHVCGRIKSVSLCGSLFSARSLTMATVVVFVFIHNFTIFAETPQQGEEFRSSPLELGFLNHQGDFDFPNPNLNFKIHVREIWGVFSTTSGESFSL